MREYVSESWERTYNVIEGGQRVDCYQLHLGTPGVKSCSAVHNRASTQPELCSQGTQTLTVFTQGYLAADSD